MIIKESKTKTNAKVKSFKLLICELSQKPTMSLLKYRPEWEKLPLLKDWLSKGKDEFQAYCRWCKSEIRPQLADIKRHSHSKKHTEAEKAKKLQPSLKTKFKPSSSQSVELSEVQKRKRRELRFALYGATHSTFRAIDPLSKLLRQEFGDKVSFVRFNFSK